MIKRTERLGGIKPQSELDMNVVLSNNATQSKHVVSLKSNMTNNKSGGIVSIGGIRDNVTTELDINSHQEKTSDQKQSHASLNNVTGVTQSMHRVHSQVNKQESEPQLNQPGIIDAENNEGEVQMTVPTPKPEAN